MARCYRPSNILARLDESIAGFARFLGPDATTCVSSGRRERIRGRCARSPPQGRIDARQHRSSAADLAADARVVAHVARLSPRLGVFCRGFVG
jgi:hypothetical protein